MIRWQWSNIQKFIDNSPVHLSFDVDVLDPKFIPCTGTPVKNGLHIVPCKFILDELLTTNLVSVDLVELNLELGSEKDQEESIYNYVKLFEGYLPFKG